TAQSFLNGFVLSNFNTDQSLNTTFRTTGSQGSGLRAQKKILAEAWALRPEPFCLSRGPVEAPSPQDMIVDMGDGLPGIFSVVDDDTKTRILDVFLLHDLLTRLMYF